MGNKRWRRLENPKGYRELRRRYSRKTPAEVWASRELKGVPKIRLLGRLAVWAVAQR
jgi:hypothetical protein